MNEIKGMKTDVRREKRASLQRRLHEVKLGKDKGGYKMKKFVVVFMAVLMLGLAMPKQSEANGAWIPAAIIGSIIFGAALNHAVYATYTYGYPAPGPAYGYGYPAPGPAYGYPAPAYGYQPSAPVYVNPPHVHHYDYSNGHGYREGRNGYWHDRGRSLPPQYGWDRPHR